MVGYVMLSGAKHLRDSSGLSSLRMTERGAQNDGALYGHVERSETSQRFFAFAQNDGALYGHVERERNI